MSQKGVNTIFFAAWLLTTCRRRQHLRPPAQPSAFSPRAHRHRHSQTSDCSALAWLSGCLLLDATVAPCWSSGPSGPCEGFRHSCTLQAADRALLACVSTSCAGQ